MAVDSSSVKSDTSLPCVISVAPLLVRMDDDLEGKSGGHGGGKGERWEADGSRSGRIESANI